MIIVLALVAVNSRITLIKTLPHTHPLFLQEGKTVVYSESFSQDVVKYMQGIAKVEKNQLKFSDVKSLTVFKKVEKVTEKNEIAIRGDVVSLWPAGYEHPIRIEFFGEDCEKLYLYDEVYGKKIRDLDFLFVSGYVLEDKIDVESIKIETRDLNNPTLPSPLTKGMVSRSDGGVTTSYSLPTTNSLTPHTDDLIIFVNSLNNIPNLADYNIIESDFAYPSLFWNNTNILRKEVARLKSSGYDIIIKTNHIEELPTDLQRLTGIKPIALSANVEQDLGFPTTNNQLLINLPAGFISNKLKLAVFTDREIFGSIYLTRYSNKKDGTIKSNKIQRLLRQLEGSIEIGDYVVHQDYGVAKYAGLRQEEADGVMNDYLLLQYAKDDELYVPLNQIDKITKYIGNEGIEPKLTRLGRASWESVKTRIKNAVKLIAKDLVEHYAKRELAEAKSIADSDSKDYLDFTHRFLYKETDDQMRAINEVISDLEKDRPMNRLLVGDVGFGKTEVIMRAAFKVVENGGQVAILAPTTVLASQHYNVFTQRFANFPIKIAMLSRFNTTKKNKELIGDINEGKIDIVIGTHRMLSSDLRFMNLELLVVDEEQRFGVKQKEKIKKLNYGAHVLYVSATPIPRTLGMALSSIQDISIITTPPINRLPIKTEIIKKEWHRLSEVISNEVERGGQVFFLHNEITSIISILKSLQELLPGVKFVVAHGRMSTNELERVMTEFYEKKYDVLISTSIIENGLDLPNVNTIIINNSHKFGLSQLYQLRGRVGRADIQAYCYLVFSKQLSVNRIKPIPENRKLKTENSLDRLQTLIENQDLGSGFRIASRDLELRGAGSFLGEVQHGHIASVGYALYVEMLAEEIEKLDNIRNAIHTAN